MLVLAALLLVAGSAAAINLRWGQRTAVIATLAFVAVGFWANYTLFGDLRLMHSGTNSAVGALVLLLLWAGWRHEA